MPDQEPPTLALVVEGDERRAGRCGGRRTPATAAARRGERERKDRTSEDAREPCEDHGENSANSSMVEFGRLAQANPMKPCDCIERHATPARRADRWPGRRQDRRSRTHSSLLLRTREDAAGVGGHRVRGTFSPQPSRTACSRRRSGRSSMCSASSSRPPRRENAAVVLCDRGTIDCSAYWTGDGDLFTAVGHHARTRAGPLRHRHSPSHADRAG